MSFIRREKASELGSERSHADHATIYATQRFYRINEHPARAECSDHRPSRRNASEHFSDRDQTKRSYIPEELHPRIADRTELYQRARTHITCGSTHDNGQHVPLHEACGQGKGTCRRRLENEVVGMVRVWGGGELACKSSRRGTRPMGMIIRFGADRADCPLLAHGASLHFGRLQDAHVPRSCSSGRPRSSLPTSRTQLQGSR